MIKERSATAKVTWIGRIMSGLIIAFMAFDGGIKLVPLQPVLDASSQLGLPESTSFARGLGVLALFCTALYAIPITSILGAILLTGYLGGAIAMQLRIGAPLFSHILFGVYLGILMWGGLWLRDQRLQELMPMRKLPLN
jgi:DoxX-like family